MISFIYLLVFHWFSAWRCVCQYVCYFF